MVDLERLLWAISGLDRQHASFQIDAFDRQLELWIAPGVIKRLFDQHRFTQRIAAAVNAKEQVDIAFGDRCALQISCPLQHIPEHIGLFDVINRSVRGKRSRHIYFCPE